MTLLLDIGNSRIKWASSAGRGIKAFGAAPRPGVDEIPAFAPREWGRMKRPRRIVAANVAGAEFGAALAAWTRQQWDIEPEWVVSAREACGVVNAYIEPARLGADRWAGLIAARRLARGAACVIDCGTALTLDVLDGGGRHLGGLIVPGLAMMRAALLERTAGVRLDSAEAGGDISLLARDTAQGVEGGTMYAVVAVIDRVVADVSAELGSRSQVIITGGDAPAVAPLLGMECRHEPHLVLQGLAVLTEEA